MTRGEGTISSFCNSAGTLSSNRKTKNAPSILDVFVIILSRVQSLVRGKVWVLEFYSSIYINLIGD